VSGDGAPEVAAHTLMFLLPPPLTEGLKEEEEEQRVSFFLASSQPTTFEREKTKALEQERAIWEENEEKWRR